MKALLQRVSRAAVSVDGIEIGSIGHGLAVLAGVADGDGPKDIEYLADKLVHLRIFSDGDGKFNLSLLDTCGEMMLVSQFTLLAETRHGRRPGFTRAAGPEEAERLFNLLVAAVRQRGVRVATGKFQTHMQLEIHNDGPVTIMLDSRERLAAG
jgi:D-tyrosyl-tRNA(Tyr) deacylase